MSPNVVLLGEPALGVKLVWLGKPLLVAMDEVGHNQYLRPCWDSHALRIVGVETIP